MIQGDPEDLLMIDQRAEYLEAVEEYQIAVEDFIDNFRFYLEDWEIQIWEQKIDKTRNAVEECIASMNKIEAELSNEAIARSDENFGAISSQKVEENVEVSQNGTEKVAKVKKSNTENVMKSFDQKERYEELCCK